MYMCIYIYICICACTERYDGIFIVTSLTCLLLSFQSEDLVPHPLRGNSIGGSAAARSLWPVTESQGLWPSPQPNLLWSEEVCLANMAQHA